MMYVPALSSRSEQPLLSAIKRRRLSQRSSAYVLEVRAVAQSTERPSWSRR